MFRFFTFLLLLATAFGLPALTLRPPADDDFYNAPLGFESQPKGTILKSRTTPAEIQSIFFEVKVKNSWQLLVRSEDALGNAIPVVTTILEPYNGNSSRVVAYNIAEDAATSSCAPSYIVQGGGTWGTIVSKAEMFIIQTALDQGFFVTLPDYEGPASGYIIGQLAGRTVLDSIRGTLNSTDLTSVPLNAEVVIWGYSGGSVPAAWSAALAPSYAPELAGNLKGVAAGGFVANITSCAVAAEGAFWEGLVPLAFNGMVQQYTDLLPLLKLNLQFWKRDYFFLANSVCLGEAFVLYILNHMFEGPFRYFTKGWDVFKIPQVVEIVNQNTLGIETTKDLVPEIPVFIYQGRLDEIVPYVEADRVYNAWCDSGISSYEFAVSLSTGHVLEAIEGIGAALKWVTDRFEGVSAVNGCQKTDRLSNLLYPGALLEYVDLVKAGFKNVFGFDIGPSDTDFFKNFLEPHLTSASLAKANITEADVENYSSSVPSA